MVSVVIPTKNAGPLFNRVLQGLQAQLLSTPYEIVVVDSGSGDRTVAMATDHGAQVFHIPPHKFNHGLTRNYGIELSKGEIVVLMSQDAVPATNDLLSQLIEPFLDAEVAGVFARQLPWPDADAVTRRNLRNWITGKTEGQVRQILDREEYSRLTPMERYLFCTFDNVCSAMRKSVWRKIGFRATCFGEDIDWSQRVLAMGWKIVYQPGAIVMHSHKRSFRHEYSRTYVCHRKLYELFRLQTVPSFRDAVRSIGLGTLADIRCTLRDEVPFPKKASQLLRVPLLTAASVWGQYAGARDERRSRPYGVEGV